MKNLCMVGVLLALQGFSASILAQTPPPDRWQALNFLLGTWAANVQGGSAGASSNGLYAFELELKRHVLARVYAGPVNCVAPVSQTFDCQHSDLLYIYQEGDGQPFKAIYLDNEGHVIHYDVSTPDATTAVFLSAASATGPQFRLIYQRKNSTMSGKFQMRMPGQTDWKSYLEWSGEKQ
jgi:hypothetical protein